MNDHNFLNTLDVFSTTQFFKINRQSSYKTKTGGVFTLIFIIAIILLLALRIDSRSRGQRMIYKSEQRYNNNELTTLNTSPTSDNNFMMGVLISDRLNQQGYLLDNFNISLDLVTITLDSNNTSTTNTTSYRLQACTADHWKVTSQVYEKYIKQYSLKNYLCLPKDKMINLQEKQGVSTFYSQIKLNKCTDLSCPNLTSISSAQLLKASTIFVNSYISQNQLKYKTYYIETLKDMFFTQLASQEVWLSFSKYDVSTDRNLLIPIPEKQILRQEGAFVKQKSDPVFSSWGSEGFYMRITIKRSTQKIILHRIDQRLLDIIAYMGGLAAIIYSIFQLIVSNYSSYAFEVEMSRRIFKESAEDNRQQKGEQAQKGKDIQAKPANNYLTNFCQYMKDKVCCCFKPSKNDQYRKEFDKHIDIESIIQKFIVFQKVITKFAQKQLINFKQMQKYHTFQEAQQFRNYLSLFFKNQPADNKQQIQLKSIPIRANLVDQNYGSAEIILNSRNQDNMSRQTGRPNTGYYPNIDKEEQKK